MQLVCGQIGNAPRRFRMIEMARRLGNLSRFEVRAVIRLLWAKNVSTSEILSQIEELFGEEAMSRQHVVKWCHSFQSGRQDVENHNIARSGWQSSSRHELKK
ncbi:hypothetical protein TNCV_1647381 [Trichonephila clavipes]|nr:hypothetical protein TNCV_1647381 [Trichonephila clavipes]